MKISLKPKNKELSKAIVSTLRNKAIKEHLILSLRNDKRYYDEEGMRKNQTLSNVETHRLKLEESGVELQRYCAQLKGKMSTFVVKVEHYERLIAQCQSEKKAIIASNEAILKQKRYEQSELLHQTEVFSAKIEKQVELISALEGRIEQIEKLKQEEGKEMMMKDNEAKAKHQEFYLKYRALLGKFNAYEQENEEEKNDSVLVNRLKPRTMELPTEDLKIKLNDIKLKNEVLQRQNDNLLSQIAEHKLLATQVPKKNNQSVRFNTLPTTANSYSNQHTSMNK